MENRKSVTELVCKQMYAKAMEEAVKTVEEMANDKALVNNNEEGKAAALKEFQAEAEVWLDMSSIDDIFNELVNNRGMLITEAIEYFSFMASKWENNTHTVDGETKEYKAYAY